MTARPVMVFAASGGAALIYQVAWQRLLTLFSGADVHSATLVVTAFMAGLGCGSLAGGHLADRVSARRALQLFALAEIGIAAFGFASPWFFYGALYQAVGSVPLGGFATGGLLFASLSWPTFLMGVSLPLLARALVRDLDRAAPTIGWLYTANTLGAAAGAFASTWILVPRLGIDGAIWVAAALNVGCAIAARVLMLPAESRGSAGTPSTADDATTVPATADRPLSVPSWAVLFAASGFLALSLEIVWFRLLGVMLKSTAFTFGTLLSLYLCGLAAGTAAGSVLAPRLRRPTLGFLLCQAGAGLYAAAIVAGLAAALGPGAPAAWFWIYFGGYEPVNSGTPLRDWLLLYVALPTVLIGPATVLSGISFPLLQRAVQTDVRHVGRRSGGLLAANIAGSAAGSLATGLLLLGWLGTAGTMRLLLGGSVVFATAAVWRAVRRPLTKAALSSAVVAAGVGLASVLPDGHLLWSKLHGAQPPHVIAAEDASGLSVLRGENAFRRVVVFVNGLGQSVIPYGGIHTVLGALPAFVHPHPTEAAVIGLGSGDTLYAMAGRSELRRITAIEIIGPQLTTLRRLAGRMPGLALDRLLADPRIEHITADGRLYVRRTGQRYDIIEADALRPTSAYAGNLYSDAYFRLLRDRLKPQGLAVTWAPTERVARTFLRAFPYVWRHSDVMIGSNEPIAFDATQIRGRLTDAARAHFAAAGVDIVQTLAPYLAGGESYGPAVDRSQRTDINTDLRPWDEFDLSAAAPRARRR